MANSIMYKYEYTFENGLKISEISDTDFNQNQVDLNINNHGDYRYYMYSNNPHMEDTFFKGIANLLSQDMTSAYNLCQAARGRFYKFDEFWKKFDEEKN